MVKRYLDEALKALDDMIAMTEKDIDAIKLARHEEIFARSAEKEARVADFESAKERIDAAIVKQVEAAAGKELEEILDEETKQKLGMMRERLEILQEHNRRFARLVVAVGDFYNALYEEMLPVERDGYNGSVRKVPSLMEVRA